METWEIWIYIVLPAACGLIILISKAVSDTGQRNGEKYCYNDESEVGKAEVGKVEVGKVKIVDLKTTGVTVEWCTEDGERMEKTTNDEWWEERKAEAIHGNAEAQYDIGVGCFSDDYPGILEGVYWILQAARQGVPDAKATLGEYYSEGTGIPIDKNTALYWWQSTLENSVLSPESVAKVNRFISQLKSEGYSASRAKINFDIDTDYFLRAFSSFAALVIVAGEERMIYSKFDFVRNYLMPKFGTHKTQYSLSMIEQILAQDPIYIDSGAASLFMPNTSTNEKLMTIQFFLELAAIEGVVTEYEIEMIRLSGQWMGVSDFDIDSQFAMFFGWQNSFENETDSPSSESKSNYSINSIENDYKILEINSSATNDEIKKAYYTQMAKYHPDKVNHLGEHLKKFAEGHCTKLNEAYERIKKERGMK